MNKMYDFYLFMYAYCTYIEIFFWVDVEAYTNYGVKSFFESKFILVGTLNK